MISIIVPVYNAQEYLKEIFGEERVLRAGTVSSFIEHTADLYVKMYEDVN